MGRTTSFLDDLSNDPERPPANGRCPLLELPLELQLQIYQQVVGEIKPLLVNMPCNSSYRGRYKIMEAEEKEWETGKRSVPIQPALTQTCRSIRVETLSLFYGENIFRACYCSAGMLPAVVTWLHMIGSENRQKLRHFYLYDRNVDQDIRRSHSASAHCSLSEIEGSEIFTEMKGRIETMSGKDCCCHLVTFGDWTRNEGQMPFGKQDGVPRLRLEGER